MLLKLQIKKLALMAWALLLLVLFEHIKKHFFAISSRIPIFLNPLCHGPSCWAWTRAQAWASSITITHTWKRKKKTKKKTSKKGQSAQCIENDLADWVQRTNLKKTLKMLSALPCVDWIEAKIIKDIYCTKILVNPNGLSVENPSPWRKKIYNPYHKLY